MSNSTCKYCEETIRLNLLGDWVNTNNQACEVSSDDTKLVFHEPMTCDGCDEIVESRDDLDDVYMCENCITNADDRINYSGGWAVNQRLGLGN
jgi:hypothetical protein